MSQEEPEFEAQPAEVGEEEADAQDASEGAPDEEKHGWWSRRRIVAVVAAAIVVIVGGFLLFNSSGSSKHTIAGFMALHDPDTFGIRATGGPCSGSGGYSDIDEGAQVTVKDGDGKLLATGHLDAGKIGDSGVDCDFTFFIDVPKANFYAIEVTHRGALTYSYDDLKSRAFVVTATLGR